MGLTPLRQIAFCNCVANQWLRLAIMPAPKNHSQKGFLNGAFKSHYTLYKKTTGKPVVNWCD